MVFAHRWMVSAVQGAGVATQAQGVPLIRAKATYSCEHIVSQPISL
jgi:hypothetical protein